MSIFVVTWALFLGDSSRKKGRKLMVRWKISPSARGREKSFTRKITNLMRDFDSYNMRWISALIFIDFRREFYVIYPLVFGRRRKFSMRRNFSQIVLVWVSRIMSEEFTTFLNFDPFSMTSIIWYEIFSRCFGFSGRKVELSDFRYSKLVQLHSLNHRGLSKKLFSILSLRFAWATRVT